MSDNDFVSRSSIADLGAAAICLSPASSMRFGHLIIGSGSRELRLDRVQAFRTLERLAHHLEEVGGLLPFQKELARAR